MGKSGAKLDKQNGLLRLVWWRFVNLFGCLVILIANFKLQQVFWLSWWWNIYILYNITTVF